MYYLVRSERKGVHDEHLFSDFDEMVTMLFAMRHKFGWINELDLQDYKSIKSYLEENSPFTVIEFDIEGWMIEYRYDKAREDLLHKKATTYDDIPNFGTLLPLKDFEHDVSMGSFVPSDGSGYYAYADKMTELSCWLNPWDVKDFEDYGFTHVMWFNK